jgi:hypothetical protein
MNTPAVDYQGSGALQYLRAEMTERREIQLLLPARSTHVTHANVINLSETITITRPLGVSEPDFEARRNLQEIRDASRLRRQLTSADLAATERALDRLRDRCGENVDNWAELLAADLSLHSD